MRTTPAAISLRKSAAVCRRRLSVTHGECELIRYGVDEDASTSSHAARATITERFGYLCSKVLGASPAAAAWTMLAWTCPRASTVDNRDVAVRVEDRCVIVSCVPTSCGRFGYV